MTLSLDLLITRYLYYYPQSKMRRKYSPSELGFMGRVIKTCKAYPVESPPAILLSELSRHGLENQRSGYSKKKRPECIDQLQKKHKRVKLPNTITIDSIYEKNFLSLTSVLEVVIVDAFLLPGTNFYMLTLGDFWSSNTIDLYLHRRYFFIDVEAVGINIAAVYIAVETNLVLAYS
ncbi:nucleic acid-binding, OB-fold protein [Tanacetum coccineum]